MAPSPSQRRDGWSRRDATDRTRSSRIGRPAPRKAVAGRDDRARHGRGAARHVGEYRLSRHHPRIRPGDRRYPVGGDLLRADLCQPAAGARAHRRHRRSRAGVPDRPDLERRGVAAGQLRAELWRDAGVSLPAGRRRRAGAELRRGTGDIALWRGAAQPGARHLHHDAGARPDARSAARRRADGGLGLARGVLVPDSDRPCRAVAVARHAGIAATARPAIASTSREASRWCWAWWRC